MTQKQRFHYKRALHPYADVSEKKKKTLHTFLQYLRYFFNFDIFIPKFSLRYLGFTQLKKKKFNENAYRGC